MSFWAAGAGTYPSQRMDHPIQDLCYLCLFFIHSPLPQPDQVKSHTCHGKALHTRSNCWFERKRCWPFLKMTRVIKWLQIWACCSLMKNSEVAFNKTVLPVLFYFNVCPESIKCVFSKYEFIVQYCTERRFFKQNIEGPGCFCYLYPWRFLLVNGAKQIIAFWAERVLWRRQDLPALTFWIWKILNIILRNPSGHPHKQDKANIFI